MDDEALFKEICSLDRRKIAKKYKYLGEGISRRVYGINDDYVIKIAKGYDGIYQNRIENHVFKNASETQIKYLCPIVWFHPERLIMKRAIPLSKFNKNEYIDIKTIRPEKEAPIDLKRLSSKFFLFYEDIISTSSWGLYQNEKVLIDYGCTERYGDFYYRIFYNW
jgi:hypothetical protein